MDNEKKIALLDRNRKIIQVILKEIEKKCPDSVDLIGITGSFCNGDYHEKSDLDLLIIRNDSKAKVLDKCFIVDGVGFDIYTQDWERIEELSNYPSPYVTKIFNLGIVYFRNQEVINRIKRIQGRLKENMQNDDLVEDRIRLHFRNALEAYDYLEASNDLNDSYVYYSRIIREIEAVVYFLNKTYIKQSTKNIPDDISKMGLLPGDFLEIYNTLVDCESKEEMIKKASDFIGVVQLYLDSFMIISEYQYEEKKPKAKKEITKEVLRGTYEELFSNYRNKLYHAVDIDSNYLSFMTLSAAQEFYNEITDCYNIPKIKLIEKYSPYDLKKNAKAFEESLELWKKLYEEYGLNVEEYSGVNSITRLYFDEKSVIKLS